MADEEDVVLSAFNSFCLGAAGGKFPQLADSDDLWRLLVTITARKAIRQADHARRQKRGGGKVRGESVFLPANGASRLGGIEQVEGAEPTPVFAAQFAEEFRARLEMLKDETLEEIALLKMQGYNNAEIAEKTGRGLRSVERKLAGIRSIWLQREDGE